MTRPKLISFLAALVICALLGGIGWVLNGYGLFLIFVFAGSSPAMPSAWKPNEISAPGASVAGVAELLDVIVKLLPNPAEGNPPVYMSVAPDGTTTELTAAPDPAKRKVAITGKKRSQCQPQCRALCIATIVIGDPLAQILPAAGVFRRNADVQERKAIPAEAVVHRDLPGNVSEEPGIDPAASGNYIRCTDDR